MHRKAVADMIHELSDGAQFITTTFRWEIIQLKKGFKTNKIQQNYLLVLNTRYTVRYTTELSFHNVRYTTESPFCGVRYTAELPFLGVSYTTEPTFCPISQ